MNAKEALQKLKDGNKAFIDATSNPGDVSPAIRANTCDNGQFPYAIVVACSDSRVIPEAMFSAGLGELFTIRVAGNIITDTQMGSIEYAADHLKAPLLVVLGHDNCGAVGSTLEGHGSGWIKFLTDEIMTAIGEEKDYYKACCLNAEYGADKVRKALNLPAENDWDDETTLKVVPAIYHIKSGEVEYL